jgi:tetratricopeptide (TPR) repeat protein
MARSLIWRSALAGIVVALAPSSSLAQQQVDTAQYAARNVVRLALFDYRLPDEQSEEDIELVWRLLGIAERLAPNDKEIARLRLEAAYATGNADATFEQTMRMLKLEPDDEVSMLRLITARITKSQTAEERIKIYEGLIGDKGREAGLSPAVRSRLALDAALLMREQGNLDAFVRLLEKSISLDSTHKEAAALAHAFYAERVNDVFGRLDLLSNLLYADPVDPNIHDAIMREFANHGAWAGAQRFFENEVRIGQAAGRQPDETLSVIGMIIAWQRYGAESLVSQMNMQLQSQRDRAQQNLRLLLREQQPITGQPHPDDIRLAIHQDAVRVIAAHAIDDQATVDAALADLARAAQLQVQALREPRQEGQELPPSQVQFAIASILDRLTSIRLWTGRQLDLVNDDLGTLERQLEEQGDAAPIARSTLDTYRGWLALRTGDPTHAIEILEPLEQGRPFVQLGLALARYDAGLEQEAIDALARIARENPVSPIGAWARTRYESITGQTFELSDTVAELEAWAKRVPTWLDRMAIESEKFISFEIQPVSITLGAMERSGLRVRIHNASPIPLGFGPGRPISSRIMLVPRTDIGVENIAGGFEPEIVDVQRKLRLMPLETFETVIWPDPGGPGYFLELALSLTSRTRWRAVLGFTITPNGIYQAGPMGQTDETNSMILRMQLAETDHAIEELARRIRDDDEAVLPRLIAAARTRVQELAMSGLPADQVTVALGGVVQSVADRYPTCSPTTRLMIAALLQPERFFAPMAPIDARIRADEDLTIRKLAIFTRVFDPADPMLEAALNDADPELSRMATIVKHRLEDRRPSYSQMSARGRGPQAPVPQGR